MDLMQIGNKADSIDVNVKNDEATVTIRSGGPCYLQLDAVDDGLAVVSAESLSAHENDLCMGLALGDIAAGDNGKARAFGIHPYGRVVTASRAASSDVWASYPAGVVGDIMSVVTATGTAANAGQVQAVT